METITKAYTKFNKFTPLVAGQKFKTAVEGKFQVVVSAGPVQSYGQGYKQILQLRDCTDEENAEHLAKIANAAEEAAVKTAALLRRADASGNY